MKIKNKRGITIISLIITIIVMIILFGITYSSGTDLIRESQRERIKSMLYMVQSRAQILLDDYLFNHDGEELNDITDEVIKAELKGTYITQPEEINVVGYNEGSVTIPEKSDKIYCRWDERDLIEQGIDIKDLSDGDVIIVEYDIKNGEVDVASLNGYVEDLENYTIIHSLKDFLK